MVCSSRHARQNEHSHDVSGHHHQRQHHRASPGRSALSDHLSDQAYASENQLRPKLSKRGRKPKEIPNEILRAFLRLLLKGGEKVTQLLHASENADGPNNQKLRKILEQLLEAGPEYDTTLDGIRVKDRDAIKRREVEQDIACDVYKGPDGVLRRLPSAPAPQRSSSLEAFIGLRSSPFTRQPPLTGHYDAVHTKCSPSTVRASLSSNANEQPAFCDEQNRSPRKGSAGSSRRSQAYGPSSAYQSPYPPLEGTQQPEACREKNLDRTETKSGTVLQTLEERTETETSASRWKSFSNFKRSSIQDYLSDKHWRRNKYIVRKGTIHESDFPSRVGTDLFVPQVGDHSDYVRMYHTPHLSDVERAMMQKFLNPVLPFCQQRPAAVTILKHARIAALTDTEVKRQLKLAVSGLNPAQRTTYIKTTDGHGISGLHLATSYGLRATCSWLLKYGADHELRAKSGAQPHEFALAAEKLVGHSNLKLYAHIMLCREHVRCGKRPPVSRLKCIKRSVRASGCKLRQVFSAKAAGKDAVAEKSAQQVGDSAARDHSFEEKADKPVGYCPPALGQSVHQPAMNSASNDFAMSDVPPAWNEATIAENEDFLPCPANVASKVPSVDQQDLPIPRWDTTIRPQQIMKDCADVNKAEQELAQKPPSYSPPPFGTTYFDSSRYSKQTAVSEQLPLYENLFPGSTFTPKLPPAMVSNQEMRQTYSDSNPAYQQPIDWDSYWSDLCSLPHEPFTEPPNTVNIDATDYHTGNNFSGPVFRSSPHAFPTVTVDSEPMETTDSVFVQQQSFNNRRSQDLDINHMQTTFGRSDYAWPAHASNDLAFDFHPIESEYDPSRPTQSTNTANVAFLHGDQILETTWGVLAPSMPTNRPTNVTNSDSTMYDIDDLVQPPVGTWQGHGRLFASNAQNLQGQDYRLFANHSQDYNMQ